MTDRRSNDAGISLRILQYAFYLSISSKLHVGDKNRIPYSRARVCLYLSCRRDPGGQDKLHVHVWIIAFHRRVQMKVRSCAAKIRSWLQRNCCSSLEQRGSIGFNPQSY